MKKAICAVLAGTVLLTLCACGAKKTEASPSPSAPATESVSPSAAPSSSPAAQDTDTKALTAILDEINSGMETGTAGSSLKATKFAAALLDWGMATKLSGDDIFKATVAWLSPKGNDEGVAFGEKYAAVRQSIDQLKGKDAKALLSDAGVTSSQVPWSDAAFAAVKNVTAAILGKD